MRKLQTLFGLQEQVNLYCSRGVIQLDRKTLCGFLGPQDARAGPRGVSALLTRFAPEKAFEPLTYYLGGSRSVQAELQAPKEDEFYWVCLLHILWGSLFFKIGEGRGQGARRVHPCFYCLST